MTEGVGWKAEVGIDGLTVTVEIPSYNATLNASELHELVASLTRTMEQLDRVRQTIQRNERYDKSRSLLKERGITVDIELYRKPGIYFIPFEPPHEGSAILDVIDEAGLRHIYATRSTHRPDGTVVHELEIDTTTLATINSIRRTYNRQTGEWDVDGETA